jgi:uncharacterized membrane protein YphA (DoxX/SURF4 family)
MGRELTRDRAAPSSRGGVSRVVDAVLDRGVVLLRIALGVVFAWFGALKVAGASPVRDLVAATVPFLPGTWFVPLVGAVEVLAGLALVLGIAVRPVAAVTVLHLMGTFLVFVVQPGVAFGDGNPLVLSVTGEFVLKNLVLVAAALVVAGHHRGRR